MLSYIKSIVMLFFIILVNLSNFGSTAYADKKPDLLLISSYHPNFPTFFQQINGLKSEFNSDKYNFDIEFMDSKRFPDQDNTNTFKKHLTDKLSKLPPYDIIFVSDDNAFNFSLANQNELFKNIPIVFLGVNNIANALKFGENKLVTGIIEASSMKETISLAQLLIPDLTKVFAITDSTTSGKSDLKLFLDYKNSFPGLELSYLSLADLSWSGLQEKVRRLDSQSCILLLSAYIDNEKQSKLFPESLELIYSSANVPIFHLWEHGMNDGILGGKLISHFQQGKQAALLAKRILSGKKVSNIPVVKKSPNQTVLDYNILERFNITSTSLPDGAVVINKPISLYIKHKHVIQIFVLILTLLTIFICFLVANIHKRKIIEKKLRKNEQIFRTLYNQSTQFAGLLTPDGKIISINTPTLNATNTTIEEVKGTFLWENFFWTSIGGEEKIKSAILEAAGGELVRFVTTSKRADNIILVLDFSAKPVLDDNNNVIEVLIEAKDITQLKKYEERVHYIDNMESIGMLAAGITHDFNNMLGGIISCAELLRRHLGENKEAIHLDDMIIESSDRAAELIRKILTFANNQESSESILNVHTIINDSIMLLKKTLNKCIIIKSELNAGSATISGDQAQLQSVFINLGINSSHAMPDNGTITFKTQIIAVEKENLTTPPLDLSPGKYIEIEVSDDGGGISEKNLDKVFEPFFTTKESGKGTGLGLAAVLNTIKQHKGTIHVESKVGEGTIFHILLPLYTKR